MANAAGFFQFSSIHRVRGDGERRYVFAYKPPGPVRRGSVEQLMLDVCKGPVVPDALVLVGLAEDVQDTLVSDVGEEAARIAQERIYGRIPLLYARYSLNTGKVEAQLLDPTFRRRRGELLSAVTKGLTAWMTSGLSAVFRPEDVLLLAPPGYAYQKPSGARSKYFLKPDLALTSSASVGFVALALFHRLFAGRLEKTLELQSVFVDTMAIAPIAYGLRDLLALCDFRQPFLIESFHSYGGLEAVRRPLPRTSICIISASTSMSLHEKWIVLKEVSPEEVITLVTISPVGKFKDGALLVIEPPRSLSSEGPPQLSIRIKGETFLPEQELAKKVLLSDVDHRSDDDVSWFCAFAGAGVFDCYRRPSRSPSKPRALFVDGHALIDRNEFVEWLETELVQRAKAATKVIVFQDDLPSRALAHRVQAFCEGALGLVGLRVVSATSLRRVRLKADDGVAICAAVVGKGSQLLEVSRALRDMHTGPRLYIVGYQVAETLSELKTLPANLRHSQRVPYDFAAFGKAAIGTQLSEAFSAEVAAYYAAARESKALPTQVAQRGRALGGVNAIRHLGLLPHGPHADEHMKLRSGFAYWPSSYKPQACHPEVLATVGVLLQRAREHVGLPDERRLGSGSYRHVLLHPENFTRFNDGVLQAALLRNAYPSELDYRGDHADSDFMKAVILRALVRASEEAGEAVLEFLLALALRRLQVEDEHRESIIAEATARRGRPRALQRAIDFVLSPLIGRKPVRTKLPF